eukprot:Gb_11493 [translate_table: standard]
MPQSMSIHISPDRRKVINFKEHGQPTSKNYCPYLISCSVGSDTCPDCPHNKL